jgi:hypothetical protein
MRKGIRAQHSQHVSATDRDWLDLPKLAEVELTSEDPAYPIETAFLPGTGSGWRAALPGEQTIRLLFDQPQRVRRIQLLFHEDQQARTQEFLLRCSRDRHQPYREIVRQQYHFSPPDTMREFEDYAVDLAEVMVLELKIVPDISGGEARASVAQFRIG